MKNLTLTNSKFRIGFFVTLLAALFLCLPGFMAGRAAGKVSPNPNVIATISSGYLLQGDGAGSYTSLGGREVYSSLTPPELNDWVLDLVADNLTGRKVYLTFSNNAKYTSTPPPDGSYSGANVHSRCFGPYPTIVQFWTIGDGNMNPLATCSLGVSFSYNGEGYLFVMSPEYSGTTPATVACNSTAGMPCTSWTITGSGKAELIENYLKPKGSVVLGTADNSFSIAVSLD